MNSEQRAHEFSLMLTEFYLKNPQCGTSEFPDLKLQEDNLVYTSYRLYKCIYQQAAKFFDEDFKE